MILNTSLAEALSAVLPAGVPAGAMVRPRGWPEAVVVVPAAAVVLGTGAISLDAAVVGNGLAGPWSTWCPGDGLLKQAAANA